MKRSSQSPHDRVLCALACKGKITKGMLRQRIGLILAESDIVLDELNSESRIHLDRLQAGD